MESSKIIFKPIASALFYVSSITYPILVFVLLVLFKLPLRIFSLFAIAFAFLFFILSSDKNKTAVPFKLFNAGLLAILAGVCFFTDALIILKLYPVLVNLLMLCMFGSTLFFPPCMIFRFATLQDKSIIGSHDEKKIEGYCKKVTVVWCGFFILNGSISTYTTFFTTAKIWSIYNGGISYLLIGVLFCIEFLVRKRVQKGYKNE
ncbi:MAG: hypothetical protein Ta2F_05150 [Termitinemataceae bacterium]|nr:MAG: hypothetical protein Ta2F_05150 [Termitinemataceae bacterium]